MKVLAVFAHPDDETVLAGGLLAFLSKTGHEVSLMTCTRGEGGETGDPPVCTQDRLGEIREVELREAAKALGCQTIKILDFIDPLVGTNNQLFSFTEDVDQLAQIIMEEINHQKIDIVISHGSNGEYGHPGHLTVFHAVEQVVMNNHRTLYWYTIQANHENPLKPWLINKNDQADWIFDGQIVKQEKLTAMESHHSQIPLFKRRKTRELGRPVSLDEIIIYEEAYCLKNKNGIDPLYNHLFSFGVLK